jgi:uncharacterized cupin superfamily protein
LQTRFVKSGIVVHVRSPKAREPATSLSGNGHDTEVRMSSEARLVEKHGGLIPEGEGWFVVNARDSRWWGNEKFGLVTSFEGDNDGAGFKELGINIRVLEPGQPNCLYHGETGQEDFLVLFGECLLLVEGEERPLKQWDFVHCPPMTQHVFVGAGSGPCAILMVGARPDPEQLLYPVADVAVKHKAAAEQETTSGDEAYATTPNWGGGRFPEEVFPSSASFR